MARAAVGVTVVGLDDLRRALRQVKDKGLNDALKKANKTVADEVIAKALPKVPVRLGRLRASVRGSGTLAGAIGKAGSAAVPYAAAIHWGRKQGGFIQARPFLQDAAKQVEQDVADRYMDELDRILDALRHR